MTATKLMEIYARLGAVINEADTIIWTLPEEERRLHTPGLASMMGDLWIKLQLPVVREHRDLDPDGDRFRKQGKGGQSENSAPATKTCGMDLPSSTPDTE